MARSRLTGRRHSRSSPAKGHCQLECWISQDAWNLLQAESSRTGESFDWIVAEWRNFMSSLSSIGVGS